MSEMKQTPKAQAAQQHTEELLGMEGVLAKGYGCVAKFAMHDSQLTVSAKGLYAYLCSLTGSGTITFPRRENILIALRLCKTSYYNALHALIDAGYIAVTRKRIKGDSWERNLYTIVSNPKRFTEQQPESGSSQLRFRGMLSGGYGMIPRLVMQDQRMNIKEKALYAYLICYADAGSAAFPKVETIQRHLGICVSSFQKYMGTLEKLGYIVKEQRREGGRFGVVDYYICEQPLPKTPDTVKWDILLPEEPAAKKWDTEKRDTPASQNPPCGEKWDTADQDISPVEAPGTKKQDTVKPDIEKSDTVFSDTISNPIPIYSHEKSKPILSEEEDHPPHKQEAVFDPESIREAMLRAKGIPSAYCSSTKHMTYALQVACDYYEEEYTDLPPAEQKLFKTVFTALCQLCTQPKTKVRTKYLSCGEVVELLNCRCVEMLPHRPDLSILLEYLLDAFTLALQERQSTSKEPLKNPVAYARYVIWDALQLYEKEEPFPY